MAMFLITSQLHKCITYFRRGVGGVLWKLIGLSIVGAGGAVGYAWYDASFRKSVEDHVPYAKEAFDYIFEILPVPKPTQPVS